MPTPAAATGPDVVPVVAAMLLKSNGNVLMAKRPIGKHHGGLWEFPGGKVESGESRESALIREIREELGVEIAPQSMQWVARAQTAGSKGRIAIVIDLYRCTAWSGDPRSLEGGEARWYDPGECDGLALPPLDRALLRALTSADFAHAGPASGD